jgi:hypothetical protein
MKRRDGMNKALVVMIAALVIALMVPASGAYAYTSHFEGGLTGGAGEIKDPSWGTVADVGVFTLDAAYTHFFDEVQTGAGPHGMREFLQHPSRLDIALAAEAMAAETTNSTIEMTSATGTFGVGFMYYTPSDDFATGVGAELVSMSGEDELKVSGVVVGRDEYTSSTVRLRVEQYIGGIVSVGAMVQGTAFETEDMSGAKAESDQTDAYLTAKAFLGGMVSVSGSIGSGEREWDGSSVTTDYEYVEVEVGIYPTQNLGILLGVASEGIDDPTTDEEFTTAYIALEYYATESFHLMGGVTSMTMEDNINNLKMDAIAVALRMGAYF